ncbi:MAG TPA: hypothetical protein VGB91_05530 [Rhizomicrobium sp.]
MTRPSRSLLCCAAFAASLAIVTSGPAFATGSPLASSGNALLTPPLSGSSAVTLNNKPIASLPAAGLAVNALSTAPQTGSAITANVDSGNDVASVRSRTGTPAALAPVAATVAPLNPVEKGVVNSVAGTLSSHTSGH